MSDRLKKHIEQQELSEFTPPSGHEARFMARLQTLESQNEQPKRGMSDRFKWMAIAASLAILMTLGISVWDLNNGAEPVMADQKMELQEVSPEMKSAEQFLMAELAKKKEKATEIVATDPDLKGFIDQLNQLENDYEQLELELNNNRDNERIIAGMIQNYRLRLELLERLFAKYQTKKRLEEQHS
jgi:hypothetical protein